VPSWTHSYIRGPSGVADWGVIIMVGGPPVLDKYPMLETGTLEHSRNRLRFVCRLYLTFKKIIILQYSIKKRPANYVRQSDKILFWFQ